MVATHSNMQALGTSAAEFSLPDVTSLDKPVRLNERRGKPLLMMFICNHCPFVIHIMEELTDLANEFKDKGFAVIAISSNDVINYPQDGPEPMRRFAEQYGFQFPYLYDESQSVAKSYGAECTPDFFIYDAQHKLRYRGQMDDSRPGNGVVVTGADLRNALSAVLAGEEVSVEQKPSIGCNIKWKA